MIKKLLGCVREYKKPSLLAPMFVALEVVIEVVIPTIMASLVDYGIDAGDMSVILKTGGALLLCATLSLLFGVLSGKYAAVASAGFARNLRHDMFHNIQDFSFANIDRFSRASIVTRLTTDASNLQNAYMMIIRIAVRSPAMLIFALVMAFRINAMLSLIFLIFIPLLAAGLFIIIRCAFPIFTRIFKAYDRLNRVISENLRGIRVVKSFVREEHEIGKFDGISGEIYRDFSKAERIIALGSPLMQFCMYGCSLLISWFGARLIVASGGNPETGMSTGQLMSLMSYIMQILMSLMMLSMIFVMLTISRASGERIVELLSEKSTLTNPENPVCEVPDGEIRFEDVSFSYSGEGGRLSLKNIDLVIPSGSTVGIIGGTGSSKTTLVQLISRLYDVTSGRITVGGVDVRDYDIEVLRDAVGTVLQKNLLFTGTVKENLRWGNENATDEEITEACRCAQADEFIRAFDDGYDTHIDQGGLNVSGGQKQRICIARALLKHPRVLILDDSTSAVDTHTDALLRRGLAEYAPGTTKLIIAQRTASVQEADMIIVMDNGMINGVGNHDELLKTNDIYREVYTSQNDGGAK